MPRYSYHSESKGMFRGQELGRMLGLVMLSLIILGIWVQARNPRNYDLFVKRDVPRVHLGADGLPVDDNPQPKRKSHRSNETSTGVALAQNGEPQNTADAPTPSAPEKPENVTQKAAPAANSEPQPTEKPGVPAPAVVKTPDAATSGDGASQAKDETKADAKSDTKLDAKPDVEPPKTDPTGKTANSPEFPDDLPPKVPDSLNQPSAGTKDSNHAPLATTPGTGMDLKDYHPVGPTDEDEDEWNEAKTFDFTRVDDSTMEIKQPDMPAYRRLHDWVSRQSLEQLRKRSSKNLKYAQFIAWPNDFRGKLVHLDLHVRRCLVYSDGMKQFGVETYYEYWGHTDESGYKHPYAIITMFPPEGMPTGDKFDELIHFDGYFLKLQGFLPAGANPGDAPRIAPLLVGRFDFTPNASSGPVDGVQNYLWWGVLFMVILFGVLRLVFMLVPKRRGRLLAETSRALGEPEDVVDIDTWLDKAEHGELSAPGNNFGSDYESMDEQADDNVDSDASRPGGPGTLRNGLPLNGHHKNGRGKSTDHPNSEDDLNSEDDADGKNRAQRFPD